MSETPRKAYTDRDHYSGGIDGNGYPCPHCLQSELNAARAEIERLTQDCARIASERACEMVDKRKAELEIERLERELGDACDHCVLAEGYIERLKAESEQRRLELCNISGELEQAQQAYQSRVCEVERMKAERDELWQALDRIRPVPERILDKIPIGDLDEILAECDYSIKLGEKDERCNAIGNPQDADTEKPR